MNLTQYVAGQQGRYKDFAELVEGMLEDSIRGNRQLRLQQAQSRAKSPASLKGKLEKAGGPVVQSILVERVQALDLNRVGASKAVVMEVLGQALRPEVRGTSHTIKPWVLSGRSQMSNAELSKGLSCESATTGNEIVDHG